MAGPIWNAELCDHEFIARAMERLDKSKDLFKTHPKINGLMTVVSEVFLFNMNYTLICVFMLVTGTSRSTFIL